MLTTITITETEAWALWHGNSYTQQEAITEGIYASMCWRFDTTQRDTRGSAAVTICDDEILAFTEAVQGEYERTDPRHGDAPKSERDALRRLMTKLDKLLTK